MTHPLAATLKLYPLLPTSVAVCAFPTVEDAANACRDLVQAGISVACVELLDDVMIGAINIKNKADGGRIWSEKPSLFLKFSGTPSSIKADVSAVGIIAKSNGGDNFTFAKNDKEAQEIWYSRKVSHSHCPHLKSAV